jgi:hypothetical protein
LEKLNSLSHLRYLNISNTNISSGLEYLPTNIEEFYCENCPGLKNTLKEFADPLEKGKYDLKSWQKENQENIKLLRAKSKLESIQCNSEKFFKD